MWNHCISFCHPIKIVWKNSVFKNTNKSFKLNDDLFDTLTAELFSKSSTDGQFFPDEWSFILHVIVEKTRDQIVSRTFYTNQVRLHK